MKPRIFYLFVLLLAVWMAWATAVPARVLAALGHHAYSWVDGELTWTPSVAVDALSELPRVRAASGRQAIDDIVIRTRVGDRVWERLGGLRWHGPIPVIAIVRMADGATLRYRMGKETVFADYLHGRSRDVNGSALYEKRRPGSARDAG